jgi:hypothetical protein
VLSVIATLGYFSRIMDGTIGGAGNLWNQLNVWQWFQVALVFYPLYLVILWEEEGMDAVVKQLVLIWGIAAWLFGFFITIISAMVNLIGNVIESIPVVE